MLFFNRYYKTIGRNIFLSNFITSNFGQLNIKLQSLSIENTIGLKSHFLYLYLMTKKRPFLVKKYLKKKIWNNVNTKKLTKIIAFPSSYKINKISSLFLFKFIPLQITAEYPVIQINKKNIKIISWNSPLFEETFCVQFNENSFIRDVPLGLTLKFDQGTFIEKLFFATFFGFITKLENYFLD